MSSWPRWLLGILMALGALIVLLFALLYPLQLNETPIPLLPTIYWVSLSGMTLGVIILIMSVCYIAKTERHRRNNIGIFVLIGLIESVRALFRVLGTGLDGEAMQLIGVGVSFTFAGLVVFLTTRQ